MCDRDRNAIYKEMIERHAVFLQTKGFFQ